MSEEQNMAKDSVNKTEYIVMINNRVEESDHKEAVSAFLMKQFHVNSIEELLTRRGVYSAVAQVGILLDELEKS